MAIIPKSLRKNDPQNRIGLHPRENLKHFWLGPDLTANVDLVEAVRFANGAAAVFVSTPADQKKAVTLDRVTHLPSEYRLIT